MSTHLRRSFAVVVAVAAPGAFFACGGSTPPAASTPPSIVSNAPVVAKAPEPTTSASIEPSASASATPPPAPSVQPTVIASNLSAPTELAIDGADAYVFDKNSGTIAKAPLAGGDAKPLVTDQKNVGGIALDAKFLYWTTSDGKGGGAVQKVPVGGGKATTIATMKPSDFGGPLGISVDDKFVYWVVSTTHGSVMRVGKTGGATTTLAGNVPTPFDVAVTADAVVWTSDGVVTGSGSVMILPKKAAKDATPKTIAEKQKGPWAIVVDATDAYWTSTGDPATGVPGELVKASLSGGGAKVLVEDARPTWLALDDAYVYWTSSDHGTVNRIAKNGGSKEVLATEQAGASGIAVDATSVYFTTAGDGSIKKLPKNGKP